MKLQGVIPIVNTTFREDGSLDLDSQARLVDYLLAAGAHGLGLFGNAGEGYTLTEAERVTILKLVADRVAGRVPLVVSSGHTGTDAAVGLSRQAEDLGASALMVLPPYYLKTDGDGLMHYFDAISRAVHIPIMVQDAPLMTQVVIPPALLARMGREIERVRYAKVEAPPTPRKISAVLEAGSDLVVLGGLNGNFMIEEIQRGARGTMPGSDMIPLFVEIWDHLEAGDTAAAWCVFSRALALIRFEIQPGLGVSAMKHNLVAAGIIKCARVRHPTVSLDPRSLEELAVLRRLVDPNPARQPGLRRPDLAGTREPR